MISCATEETGKQTLLQQIVIEEGVCVVETQIDVGKVNSEVKRTGELVK